MICCHYNSLRKVDVIIRAQFSTPARYLQHWCLSFVRDFDYYSGVLSWYVIMAFHSDAL